MKKLFSSYSVAILLSFNSLCMAAATDFIDNGDYTTDTLSGLDWLDVTITAGLSYDEVSEQLNSGGNYEGWRYATGAEFITMVDNFTDGSNVGNYGQIDQETDKIDALVILLGSTADLYALDLYGKTYDTILRLAEGEGLDETTGLLADTDGSGHYGAKLYDYDDPNARKSIDYSLARSSNTVSDSLASLSFGSYLVRNNISAVPVPAAAYLFLPALIGLFSFRNKSERSKRNREGN